MTAKSLTAPPLRLRFPARMSTRTFMRDYWQKKPLLIRGALPAVNGQVGPIGPEDLFALAAREDVESRLVRREAGNWSMVHGPHARLPARPRKGAGPERFWTLLVQGVNLHDDHANALLRQFNFISAARLDDLMISYATDGGGVGPHFDSYDVFLLQTMGQRRWRISAHCRPELIEGIPIRILRHFEPEQEWVLDAGDMLYLPPQYAHEGTAIGPCMTASIGFRAPALAELAGEFLHTLADDLDIPGRYSDPGRKPSRTPARIDAHMVDALANSLSRLRWSRSDLAAFLAAHLSEPKPQVFFDDPGDPLSAAGFTRQARRLGLRLHRKSTMLYTGSVLCINGERLALPSPPGRVPLLQLADQRHLPPAACAVALADTTIRELLHEWFDAGWIEFDNKQSNTNLLA